MNTPAEQYESVSSDAEPTVNVSGYRFVHLDNLPALQANMRAVFNDIGVKGTILIAEEGINAALAGTAGQIQLVREWFESDQRFKNLWLKESFSQTRPFSKMKIRIRPEIITFQPGEQHPVSPATNPAPNLSPTELKNWLDKKADFTLLDTRNTYEIESGTFKQATNLKLNTFREFTSAVQDAITDGRLNRDTPIVTFCTGGIRCEKAAPYLKYRKDKAPLRSTTRSAFRTWPVQSLHNLLLNGSPGGLLGALLSLFPLTFPPTDLPDSLP